MQRILKGLAAAPTAMLALLLALAWLCPGSNLVGLLQGKGSLGAELKGTQAAGYYENLLAMGQPARAPVPREPADPPPPPGLVPFHESGLAEAEASYLRFRLRPGLNMQWNGIGYQINRLGHRGPEIAIPKPAGTYRVVVLGSSNTFGHGVEDDDTYVRLLEAWLNEHAPPGLAVEVVNLSAPGRAPSQRLYRLRDEEVERLQPNWIVCDATAVDVWLEQKHLHAVVTAGLEPPFDFVREAIRKAGVKPGDTLEAVCSKLEDDYEELLAGTYAGWSAEARRLDVPLTVVILPRADAKVESPRLFQLLRTMANRHGLPYIDLADVFDDLTVEEFRIASWDKHPSVRGHRLIFEALRDAIQRQGGPPGLALPKSGNEESTPVATAG